LELITGPRSLLPAGFDENSGRILSEQDYNTFSAGIAEMASVRRTGGQSTQADNSAIPHTNEAINQNDRFRQDDSLPEWLSYSSAKQFSRMGELVCVTGTITSHGWSTKNQMAAKDRADDPEMSWAKQRLAAGLPTEFEIWLTPGSTGLFVLDGPATDLVNIVSVTCSPIPSPRWQTPNRVNAEELAATIALLNEPRAQAIKGSAVSGGSAESLPEKGFRVKDKPGYLMSPWAMDLEPVDARGFPSGAMVKCPYTGKAFLVP
jgi:hypothetical protein